MMNNTTSQEHLFILDIDSIQSYIFNTNRLKTIIGASWLIDHINADEEEGNTYRLIRESDAEIIYSAGGNTKLIFPSCKSAETFEQKIKKVYSKYGISVTTHIHEIEGNPDEIEIERNITPAEKILAQKKYNKSNPSHLPASPFFKLCELCGKGYAEAIRKDRRDDIVICPICDQKFGNAGKPLRLFHDYKFFADIQEMKTEKDMIAVVVMDGNNMSDKIKRLDTSDDLKNFANKTEEIVKKAFDACLMNIFPEDKEKKEFNSIRPLIIGGDDICLIIDAVHALDFVQQFTEKVEKKSQAFPKLFGEQGIAFSSGILFIKKNYPFNFAHRIAESLLRSAKRFSRENGDCSSIDFHVLLSSSGDEIEKTRAREYEYGDHVLTQKPFRTDGMAEYKKNVGRLNNRLARSKVKYLRQTLRRSREASMVEMLKLALRMEEKPREDYIALLNKYSWQKKDDKWHTGILDLVEMTDFFSEKKKDN